MAFVTVTAVQTISDLVGPSESPITSTLSIQTIIATTPGQTITLGTAYSYVAPSLKYTPTFVPTQTYTVTEYDIFLEDPRGSIWTTMIFDAPNSPDSPGEHFFVVPYSCTNWWSCWSPGQKAGLTVGVIFGAIFLLLLICCFRKWRQRKIWISHGAHGANDYERWQNSRPGWGYHGPPQVNLQTGFGLRPYMTPTQAEAALRGGESGPPATPAGEEMKKGKAKVQERKDARQKLGAWITG